MSATSGTGERPGNRENGGRERLTGRGRANSRVTPHKATNKGSSAPFELHSWPCAEKRHPGGRGSSNDRATNAARMRDQAAPNVVILFPITRAVIDHSPSSKVSPRAGTLSNWTGASRLTAARKSDNGERKTR